EHSVVAQGCGLSTIHSYTPSVRLMVSTPCVRQLDASSDIRSQRPVTSLDSRLAPTVNTNTSQRRNRQNPIVNLSTSRQLPPASRPTSDYRYLGSCTYSCQHCGALFWDDERLKSVPRSSRPRYNRCCRGGRVVLRTYQMYPELFQQYVVTAFCAIEQNKIDYVRENQNDIRSEYLSGIYDAINREDSDGSDCGIRVILPQSFTGGPRYMYNHYLDALAICRVHGNPSFL
nr:DNA helicase [Tanacetum cinerariifolium]